MPVYQYRALDEEGKTVKGLIDASTPQEARQKLRERNIYPTQIWEEEVSVRGSLFRSTSLYWRRTQDVLAFTRQLGILLKAGLPLVPALTSLLEQMEGTPFKKVLYDLREKVSGGISLSEALSSHSRFFSPLYVNLVRAGEISGNLEDILTRLAEVMGREIALKNRIRAMLSYPVFITLVGVGVVVFLMAFVIPTLNKVFLQMNQTLPPLTLFLMSASSIFRRFWWVILFFVFLSFYFWRKFSRSARGRLYLDKFLLRLPVLGELLKKSAIARFTRTLSTLIRGGIPLLQSLELAANVVGNRIIAQAIISAKESVKEGEDIAAPLKRTGIFPPPLVHTVSVGEKSGNLEEMLLEISDTYEEEVTTSVNALTSILEPVIILIMGLIVALMVVSIILPIFEMNQIIR